MLIAMERKYMLRLLELAAKQKDDLIPGEADEYEALVDWAGQEGLTIVFDNNRGRPHLAIYLAELDEEK